MPREGTRSQTGNSKPRVFTPIDTAPAVKRTTKPKKKAAPKAGAKPTGVTKTSKKEGGVVKKVKAAVKKVEKKVKKETKPKTTKKEKPVGAPVAAV